MDLITNRNDRDVMPLGGTAGVRETHGDRGLPFPQWR
jgi:hypothetical protein